MQHESAFRGTCAGALQQPSHHPGGACAHSWGARCRPPRRSEPDPPPEPSTDAPSVLRGQLAPGEVARSLDWSGHDILLLSIDALRADHVSAYGYPRPTTPNIDAIAREGTVFDAAYCPTPHTSYSVTSVMTGKYLRPLLSLGMGDDSETWAQDLRQYGWRTAAFYPPAVFFIDQDRFPRFEETHLGFEYSKVEFADPGAARAAGVAVSGRSRRVVGALSMGASSLSRTSRTSPTRTISFTGGPSADEDAYDGEIATADDGIGGIVREVRARRPGAVIVVTADHGEEFGDHGGRYHGTTVYEEQVRVPLVVVGPGGARRGAGDLGGADHRSAADGAVGAGHSSRPARLRGRDLGPLLAGDAPANDGGGLAFAETGDYALVASGPDRLICERRAAACALYRPGDDPGEKRDVALAEPTRFDELRGILRSIERDHGRYEAGGGRARGPRRCAEECKGTRRPGRTWPRSSTTRT